MGRLTNGYSKALGLVSFCCKIDADVLLCNAINNGPAWANFVSKTVKYDLID